MESKDEWNPCNKIHEKLCHKGIDQLMMNGKKSAHTQHDLMHWGNACFHEWECLGLPRMEGGPSNILPEL